MKIKRYEAKDISTALQTIKSELGPEAIILSTKRLRKGNGLLGGSRKPMIEVVAAIDYEPREPAAGTNSLPVKNNTSYLSRETSNPLPEICTLRAEIANLKRLIQTTVRPANPAKPLKHAVDALTAYLGSIGLEAPLVCSLLEGVALDGKADSAEASGRLKDIITGRLMHQVVLGRLDEEGTHRQRIWAFIGPTGVGKTTTCAKLAAHFALKGKKKVALFSVDNYRIAASEQLRTYAQILGVPFTAIFKDEELSRAIKLNQDKDMILIDTAGRNPHHEEHMNELARYVYSYPTIEGQVVLSANTQNGDMENVLMKYMSLPVKGCIFSKIDESRFYGPIFNQSVRFKVPIYYLTIGQRVPEDIEEATRKRLAHLLWSELRDNRW